MMWVRWKQGKGDDACRLKCSVIVEGAARRANSVMKEWQRDEGREVHASNQTDGGRTPDINQSRVGDESKRRSKMSVGNEREGTVQTMSQSSSSAQQNCERGHEVSTRQ